jgi:predicted enzyme related to lactoylglutathione lyase
MSGPSGTYTIVSTSNADVGGIMALAAEACAAGAKPSWVAYIGVDDVDAFVKKVKAAGGSIQRPTDEIPGIGRFAVVADPHGAVFMMMTPLSKEHPPVPPKNTPGHVGWRELHAGDGPEAWKFYSELFGWTKGEDMEVGTSAYQTFSTGGDPIGGIMTKMPEAPAPFWMFYFNVDALDPAADRVAKAGGKIIHGPMQVPGGNWIANFVDSQGAMFSLMSTKR